MNNYVNGYNLRIVFIWGINTYKSIAKFWKWVYQKSVLSLFLNGDAGAQLSYVVLFKVTFLAWGRRKLPERAGLYKYTSFWICSANLHSTWLSEMTKVVSFWKHFCAILGQLSLILYFLYYFFARKVSV